jgi:hypothetical protein
VETAVFLTTIQEERLALYAAFRQMAFDENDALRLAQFDADPHAAEELMAHGCSRDLVVEILA